jgi:hypothetical protein
MMHQPIEPNRGSSGRGPLPRGIKLVSTERMMWTRYFRRLWPTVGETFLIQMVNRMIDSMVCSPMGPYMTKTERMTRVKQLKNGLDRIPPDANNKLMGG